VDNILIEHVVTNAAMLDRVRFRSCAQARARASATSTTAAGRRPLWRWTRSTAPSGRPPPAPASRSAFFPATTGPLRCMHLVLSSHCTRPGQPMLCSLSRLAICVFCCLHDSFLHVLMLECLSQVMYAEPLGSRAPGSHRTPPPGSTSRPAPSDSLESAAHGLASPIGAQTIHFCKTHCLPAFRRACQ